MPALPEPIDGWYLSPAGRRVLADAVSWAATRSGGPGGQHANTSDTAVTVTIDVVTTGLPAPVIERVLGRAGATITATAANTRSQWRNRQLAWQAAMERLDAAATPPAPPRAKTRPSRAAREERLADKRKASERKQARRRPVRDD